MFLSPKDREKLEARLKRLNYPCALIAYGHEEDYKSTYRTVTYDSHFDTEVVADHETALEWVEAFPWRGPFDKLRLRAIYLGSQQIENL